jgi:hypothetical protein
MFGRLEKKYVGDKLLKEGQITRKQKDQNDYAYFFDTFFFEAFSPSTKLVEDINKSLSSGHPLLITGERYLRELPGRSVAFEVNEQTYECFKHFFFVWKIKKGEKFHGSIYSFDHQAKKRDLEYHQMCSDQNPLRENSFYFKTGPLLRLLEMRVNDPTIKEDDPNGNMVLSEVPIMEIQDVHKADEDFIIDLLEFLNSTKEVFIPELDKTFSYDSSVKPLIIMTADEGFKLPISYDGVIYSHHMEFPEKEELISSFITYYQSLSLFDESSSKKIEQIIEKMVDLFFLAKDNCFLRPDDDTEFPLSLPQLRDSIEIKVRKALKNKSAINTILKELTSSYNSQLEVGQNINIDKATSSIKKHIEKGKLREAFRSLKLIQKNLSQSFQTEISQLLSIYNEIAKKERLGTESELILYPMRNKLKFDLLTILDELGTGNNAYS